MQKYLSRKKQKWGQLIERYLHGSEQLKAVFLLIDIRHDPSANDRTDVQLDRGAGLSIRSLSRLN